MVWIVTPWAWPAFNRLFARARHPVELAIVDSEWFQDTHGARWARDHVICRKCGRVYGLTLPMILLNCERCFETEFNVASEITADQTGVRNMRDSASA